MDTSSTQFNSRWFFISVFYFNLSTFTILVSGPSASTLQQPKANTSCKEEGAWCCCCWWCGGVKALVRGADVIVCPPRRSRGPPLLWSCRRRLRRRESDCLESDVSRSPYRRFEKRRKGKVAAETPPSSEVVSSSGAAAGNRCCSTWEVTCQEMCGFFGCDSVAWSCCSHPSPLNPMTNA